MLGALRRLGLERLEVSCVAPNCGYEKSVTVSNWPDDIPVPDVGARLTCPKCGPANSIAARIGSGSRQKDGPDLPPRPAMACLLE